MYLVLLLSEMESLNPSSAFVNEAQKQMLIDLLRENEALRSGRFSPNFTRQDFQKQWKEIADQLNRVTGGAVKD